MARPWWTERDWLMAPLGYRPSEDPWALPAALHRVAFRGVSLFGLVALPLVMYVRAGDRVLFCLWWWSRPAVWWLADTWGVDPVIKSWVCARCMHGQQGTHAAPCGERVLGPLRCRCPAFVPPRVAAAAARAALTAELSSGHEGHGCAVDAGIGGQDPDQAFLEDAS